MKPGDRVLYFKNCTRGGGRKIEATVLEVHPIKIRICLVETGEEALVYREWVEPRSEAKEKRS